MTVENTGARVSGYQGTVHCAQFFCKTKTAIIMNY